MPEDSMNGKSSYSKLVQIALLIVDYGTATTFPVGVMVDNSSITRPLLESSVLNSLLMRQYLLPYSWPPNS
jgi:hypothetical protein